MATRVNIMRHRGDTYPEQFTITDSSGTAVDITGYTFTLTVSTTRRPSSASNLFQVSGTITDASAGEVEFDVSTDNADNEGLYWYDVQMTASSRIYTLFEGTWTFIQDRTK